MFVGTVDKMLQKYKKKHCLCKSTEENLFLDGVSASLSYNVVKKKTVIKAVWDIRRKRFNIFLGDGEREKKG